MISINWPTGEIYVPKADMTQTQTNPYEVRKLDVNSFRLALKDLEAGYPGMGFPKTHDHNTEQTLAGTTFARQVKILDPYTVTFENGNYAVDVLGGNTNIADRVNLNSVMVRTSNSAGLIVVDSGGGNADITYIKTVVDAIKVVVDAILVIVKFIKTLVLGK